MESLQRLATRVFKTFETEETLWETYVHRLARPATWTTAFLTQGVPATDMRQFGALIEVSRHLPHARLAKVWEYAKDQFEAEFGHTFVGSSKAADNQEEDDNMNVKHGSKSEEEIFTKQWLEAQGFEGFVTVAELRRRGVRSIPSVPGVYVVLTTSGSAVFLDENPGGRFKQRDPTVSLALLKDKWIDGSDVVYIGKGNDLRRRVKQFIDFGAGRPVGHWGGRYTWQLPESDELVIAWKQAPEGTEARDPETELLGSFADAFGALPFANLTR